MNIGLRRIERFAFFLASISFLIGWLCQCSVSEKLRVQQTACIRALQESDDERWLLDQKLNDLHIDRNELLVRIGKLEHEAEFVIVPARPK